MLRTWFQSRLTITSGGTLTWVSAESLRDQFLSERVDVLRGRDSRANPRWPLTRVTMTGPSGYGAFAQYAPRGRGTARFNVWRVIERGPSH